MTEHDIADATKPGAQTLALQSVVNRIMRGVFRTPLLCRVVGKRLIILYVVGRKSGRRYVVPVAYARDGDALVIGTPFGWVRNLRSGEQISVRYKGKRRVADVQVFTDQADVVEHYALIAGGNHAFAKFNRIDLDGDGNPDPADLRLAWAAGARAVRLMLRP
jgi:deazaflavin-dependent oxidoreductase (nitroreductase family)